ncbi:MAG: hypothetical protein EZS28_041483 [Streblomastix strix]|uniref:Reverse transcriptase domain-containing protein n=1 Tax=Streblomastix strix TaxID=222440 RepID=A0A5J4TY04_9EUKA|nr:MAG: hypothetical protein EZS28_041483 [Streblomastix strix]
MITLRITEISTITEKEDRGIQKASNERRTARDARNRIFTDQYRWKEKKENRMELRAAWRRMSPEQSRRQIIELLAAFEIVKSERQKSQINNTYLERPRQSAQPRSLQTQDHVQRRLGYTQELIQEQLVRAGGRRYNPGPGLFRQVQEFNIRNSKEEKRLKKDPGLSNLEQQTENGVFQIEEIIDIQEIIMAYDWATRIDLYLTFHLIRAAEEMRPYLYYSFNGYFYNYNGMPFRVSTISRTFIKCLQPVTVEARMRCRSRIFVYIDDILILNQVPTILLHEIQQVRKILQEFGLKIAMGKNQIKYAQKVEFLGRL